MHRREGKVTVLQQKLPVSPYWVEDYIQAQCSSVEPLSEIKTSEIVLKGKPSPPARDSALSISIINLCWLAGSGSSIQPIRVPPSTATMWSFCTLQH